MLIDRPHIHEMLSAAVHRLTTDVELFRDLMQEAQIHCCQSELCCPGHSAAWHVKDCVLFLHNRLRSGRSIDSLKHQKLRSQLSEDPDDFDPHGQYLAGAEEVFSTAWVDDFSEELKRHLRPRDRLIFDLALEGFSTKEIAPRMHLSPRATSKHREGIRAEAIRLGLEPASTRHN